MLHSRDPFARTELHSKRVTPWNGQTCDWCGDLGPDGKLKEFETQTDGGRHLPIKGKFCRVACMRAYHGA